MTKTPGYVLMGAGALLIAFAGGVGMGGAWRESSDRAQFERTLHIEPTVAQAQAPVDAVGVLRVDRLGWSVIVRPSASDADLARGAGWIGGTAVPGSQGNAGIAGHRDTFFRALRHFKINDDISLETGKGTVHYVVRELRIVDPDNVEVIAPDRRASLTLVTCYPFYLVGHAPRRFIVKAYLKRT